MICDEVVTLWVCNMNNFHFQVILEPASRGMVGDEAQLTQCGPNLAQSPNSSLNFAQNWKKELLIRVVQDRPQRM